jgi:hypothetical protein
LNIPKPLTVSPAASRRKKLWSRSWFENYFMKAVSKKTEKEQLQLKRREEYYQRKLSQYRTWLSKSDQLLEAAKILAAKIKNDFESLKNLDPSEKAEKLPFGLLEIHFFLVGFALENSLKAKWVKKNRRGLKNEIIAVSELPNELKTHNLLQLAEKVGLRLEDGQKELLNRLSEYTQWAARYPVPLKASDLKPRSVSGSDLDKLHNLVSELNRQLWRGRHNAEQN